MRLILEAAGFSADPQQGERLDRMAESVDVRTGIFMEKIFVALGKSDLFVVDTLYSPAFSLTSNVLTALRRCHKPAFCTSVLK